MAEAPDQSPKIPTPNQANKPIEPQQSVIAKDNRDLNRDDPEVDPNIMPMQISDQERQELTEYITEDLDMDISNDQDKPNQREFQKPKPPAASATKTQTNKTPRRGKSPEKRKSRDDKARKYSYSSTSSRSSGSSQTRSQSTCRTKRSDTLENHGSDAASERENDKDDRKEKQKEDRHWSQKKKKRERLKERRRSDSDSLSARETTRGTIVMRRNEIPKELNEKGRKKVDEQGADKRKIEELEKQVKELTAELAVRQEKEDRVRENQEVLANVGTEDAATTRNESEKGHSQVDLLIEKLLQILLNFSEGKFWPKGADSFQTKVFQDYLEKHFDMYEFRTFLKENFKDLNGYVDKPL